MAVVGLLWETVGSLVHLTREVGCRKNNKLGFFRWLVFCLWIVYLTQALHPNKKWKEWENFECEESWTIFHKLSSTSPNFLIHFFFLSFSLFLIHFFLSFSLVNRFTIVNLYFSSVLRFPFYWAFLFSIIKH